MKIFICFFMAGNTGVIYNIISLRSFKIVECTFPMRSLAVAKHSSAPNASTPPTWFFRCVVGRGLEVFRCVVGWRFFRCVVGWRFFRCVVGWRFFRCVVGWRFSRCFAGWRFFRCRGLEVFPILRDPSLSAAEAISSYGIQGRQCRNTSTRPLETLLTRV